MDNQNNGNILSHGDVVSYLQIFRVKGLNLIENGQREKAIENFQWLLGVSPGEFHEVINNAMEIMQHYDFELAYHCAEKYEKDEIFAHEYYYLKALRLDKECQILIRKIARLECKLNKRDDKQAERISRKKGLYENMCPDRKSRITAERHHHIVYNTVVMEGNKFALDEVKDFLQRGVSAENKSYHDHLEVLEASAAINVIERSLPNSYQDINLEFILHVHAEAVKLSKPAMAGRLRDVKVSVGSHEAPDPQQVLLLLEGFLQAYRAVAPRLPPINAAAASHLEVVDIHPFEDGNGRTCRLLMNTILLMNGYPSVVIPVSRNQAYYKSLEMAHDDYKNPFVRYVTQCVEEALDEYLSD